MIKSLFLIVYNLIRMAVCSLCHPGHWQVKAIQRISPLCALKVFEHGSLKIGRNCELAAYCDLEVHGKGVLTIGEKTYMNRYCMISAHEEVTIGKECMFGPGVKIFDNDHVHSPETGVSTKLKTAPIRIGDHCWIASDVIILRGTTIGDNSVIGAGCIVKGEVPAGTVVRSARTEGLSQRKESLISFREKEL